MKLIEKNAYLWFSSTNRRLLHFMVTVLFINFSLNIFKNDTTLPTITYVFYAVSALYLILNIISFQFLHAFDPYYLGLGNPFCYFLRIYLIMYGYIVLFLYYIFLKLNIKSGNALLLVILYITFITPLSLYSLDKIISESYDNINFSKKIVTMFMVSFLLIAFGSFGISIYGAFKTFHDVNEIRAVQDNR